MRIDYHNRRFRGAANSETGDVSGATIFHYRQTGEVVWATYEGGAIRFGTLVALAESDGALDMRYQPASARA